MSCVTKMISIVLRTIICISLEYHLFGLYAHASCLPSMRLWVQLPDTQKKVPEISEQPFYRHKRRVNVQINNSGAGLRIQNNTGSNITIDNTGSKEGKLISMSSENSTDIPSNISQPPNSESNVIDATKKRLRDIINKIVQSNINKGIIMDTTSKSEEDISITASPKSGVEVSEIHPRVTFQRINSEKTSTSNNYATPDVTESSKYSSQELTPATSTSINYATPEVAESSKYSTQESTQSTSTSKHYATPDVTESSKYSSQELTPATSTSNNYATPEVAESSKYSTQESTQSTSTSNNYSTLEVTESSKYSTQESMQSTSTSNNYATPEVTESSKYSTQESTQSTSTSNNYATPEVTKSPKYNNQKLTQSEFLIRLLGKTFVDTDIPTRLWSTKKFYSSKWTIENDYRFSHHYKFPNLTTGWELYGRFSPEDSEKRVRWDGGARIPGGPEITNIVGYIYFIYADIKESFTTLAYYSCWTTNRYNSSGVYITQTISHDNTRSEARYVPLREARERARRVIAEYNLSGLHQYR